jgi:hypothetical protein
MNEDQLCQDLGAKLLAEHQAASPGGRGAGPHGGRLGDALKALRAAGVPWMQIFALVPQIIAALGGTGDWNAVIAAIFALFNRTPTGAVQTP